MFKEKFDRMVLLVLYLFCLKIVLKVYVGYYLFCKLAKIKMFFFSFSEDWGTRTYCCEDPGCNNAFIKTSSFLLMVILLIASIH